MHENKTKIPFAQNYETVVSDFNTCRETKLLLVNAREGVSELPWLRISDSYGYNYDYLCTIYVRTRLAGNKNRSHNGNRQEFFSNEAELEV